jgi:hypothetical protein
VFDTSPIRQAGKYTLGVGEIEDFSPLDFFTIIPSAWLDTKFFFGDYLSPAIAISLLVTLLTLIGISLVKRVKRRETQNPASLIIFPGLQSLRLVEIFT